MTENFGISTRNIRQYAYKCEVFKILQEIVIIDLNPDRGLCP
jgi:hypothetical protein